MIYNKVCKIVANHKTMSEYARLSGMLPPGLESIIREYAHPVHRKPEHGIMMTKLYNIIKKPIANKFRDLINAAADAEKKCAPDFLYDRELGNLFNNPLEHTQYASEPYNDFIKRYDAKALSKLLQCVKKKMTKSYCKLKNKPYNKKVGVKDLVKISSYIKKYNRNMKFKNNSELVSDRFVELLNQLVDGLQNDVLEEDEEWQIRYELKRLDTLYYQIKIKNAKTRNERRAIKKVFRNSQNNRMVNLLSQYPFLTWHWDDIRDHTYYYGYNKTAKAMKRTNLQRYQMNYQKRSCNYTH